MLSEFKRLSLNSLHTRARTIVDFISTKKGVSTLTFNVQSLKSHRLDLTDSVTQKTNILLLSETNMGNDHLYEIPNFNCIVHYKRANIPSGGVAIYQSNDDTVNILAPNMDIIMRNTNNFSFKHSSVGDICSAICKMENGVKIVMVVVYIAQKQKLIDIQEFIHRSLLEYSEGAAVLLEEYGTYNHQLPLILAGDFNINFKDKQSESFKTFLMNKFNLKMNNNQDESTTRDNTTIDAVFSRYLTKIKSQTYTSYFSYHKAIVSMIEND